jgi:hypothetical protein
MQRLAIALAGVICCLAGCTPKPAAEAVDPCRKPALATTLPAGTYAGEAERAAICVKFAAYDAARRGGPIEVAATAAVQSCAGQEQAELQALAKTDKVYPWEKGQIHDRLAHLALLTVRQARSKGCGKAPGEGPDEP